MILTNEEVDLIRKYPYMFRPAVETYYGGGPDGSHQVCNVCGARGAGNYFYTPEKEELPPVHKDGCEHVAVAALRNKLLGV